MIVCLLYCLPRHPSAPASSPWDAVLHVGLFATIALAFARLVSRRRAALCFLLALAVLLELLQWALGGYTAIEHADIGWNVAGVALGWFGGKWRRSSTNT